MDIEMSAEGDCGLKFGIRRARCKSGQLHEENGPSQTTDLDELNRLSFTPCTRPLIITAEITNPFGSGNLNSGFEIWRGGHRIVEVNILKKTGGEPTVRLETSMSGYYVVEKSANRTDDPFRIRIRRL